MQWRSVLSLLGLAAGAAIGLAKTAVGGSTPARGLHKSAGNRPHTRGDGNDHQSLRARSSGARHDKQASNNADLYAQSHPGGVDDHRSRKGPAPPPAEPENFPWPVIGAGAVVAVAAGGGWMYVKRNRPLSPEWIWIRDQMDRLPQFIDPADPDWRCFSSCARYMLKLLTVRRKLPNIYLEDVLDNYCTGPEWCNNGRVRSKARQAQDKRLADERWRAAQQSLDEAAQADDQPALNHDPANDGTNSNVEGPDTRPSMFQAAVSDIQRGFAAAKMHGFSGIVAAALSPKSVVKKTGRRPGKVMIPKRFGF